MKSDWTLVATVGSTSSLTAKDRRFGFEKIIPLRMDLRTEQEIRARILMPGPRDHRNFLNTTIGQVVDDGE